MTEVFAFAKIKKIKTYAYICSQFSVCCVQYMCGYTLLPAYIDFQPLINLFSAEINVSLYIFLTIFVFILCVNHAFFAQINTTCNV